MAHLSVFPDALQPQGNRNACSCFGTVSMGIAEPQKQKEKAASAVLDGAWPKPMRVSDE